MRRYLGPRRRQEPLSIVALGDGRLRHLKPCDSGRVLPRQSWGKLLIRHSNGPPADEIGPIDTFKIDGGFRAGNHDVLICLCSVRRQ